MTGANLVDCTTGAAAQPLAPLNGTIFSTVLKSHTPSKLMSAPNRAQKGPIFSFVYGDGFRHGEFRLHHALSFDV